MRDPSGTKQDVIARQERMLRLAERDYKLTAKVLFAETGIPIPTLQSWRKDVAMPAWALVLLSEVIPDELTSLLFEPAGKFVGSFDSTPGDLDRLGCEAARYLHEKLEAESDGIVTPMERRNLQDTARRIASVARRAAA